MQSFSSSTTTASSPFADSSMSKSFEVTSAPPSNHKALPSPLPMPKRMTRNQNQKIKEVQEPSIHSNTGEYLYRRVLMWWIASWQSNQIEMTLLQGPCLPRRPPRQIICYRTCLNASLARPRVPDAYLVAGSEGLLVEPATSKEALREVQAQPALATLGHCIEKILR